MRIPDVNKTAFRVSLVAACHGCRIQHTGWPCGSCFQSIFTHEDWVAVLAYRGDYEDHRVTTDDGPAYRMATDHTTNADGSFKEHVFTLFPERELRARVRALNLKLMPRHPLRQKTEVDA